MAEAGSVDVAIRATTEGLRAGMDLAVGIIKQSAPDIKRAVEIGLGALAATLAASVYQFASAERAATSLAVALRNQGDGTRKTLRDLMDFDEQLQRHSRFSDDEIMTAQTMLATAGLQGEALKRATLAMVNMGTQTGDLTGASRLLANAFEGNATGAHRFGITVQEGLPKGLVFGEMLRQIELGFGGRAAADAETLAGKVDVFGHNLADAGKVIGEMLSGPLKTLLDYFNENRENMMKFAEKLADKLFDILEALRQLVNFLTAHKAILQGVLGGAAIGGSVGLLGLGIGAIPGALIGAVAGGLGGKATEMIGNSSVGGGLNLPPIKRGRPGSMGEIDAGDGGSVGVRGSGPTGAQVFKAAWKDAYDKVFANFGTWTQRIEGVMRGFTSSLSSGINGFLNDILLNSKNVGQALMNIGNSLLQFFLKMVSDAIAHYIAKELFGLAIHKVVETSKTAATVSGIEMASAAHTAAASKAIAEDAAEAEAGVMAAHSKIPFVGIAIGLAAAAAVFGIIMSFKKFALGGIINGPTMGMLGETGEQEAVINLESQQGRRALAGALSAAGGGGGGATVHINGTFLEGDPAKWERMVRNVIIPALERHGRKTRRTTGTVW
jgi:hypothetical protein